jgi:hypothetical protein
MTDDVVTCIKPVPQVERYGRRSVRHRQSIPRAVMSLSALCGTGSEVRKSRISPRVGLSEIAVVVLAAQQGLEADPRRAA